ncbi:MAG: glycosyltransferase family 4 protein [Verrucomicrobiota bacterium]
MKLLFVHERFGALAGAEANAHITATELKRRGHVVGIIHGPTTGKAEAAWQETFTDRFSLRERGNAQRVQAALDSFQPDIIYVHKMAELEVIDTLVRSKIPLVRMVHDHDIYCMRSYKYNYFTRKICTNAAGLRCIFPCVASFARNSEGGFPLKFISYSDKKREIRLNHQFQRMVVVTNYMKDELLRNGFEAEKIEIHPPVPRMGDPDLRSSFSERNLIVYAGQIIRGKGVDVLLESLARLTVPFECIILGDGTHRPFCEALSKKLKLDDRVKFMGFVPQEELKNFYRECTIMAISSVWPEPFATIGMEAMRYGIPVVAFDAGGIKDWLKDGQNGFLVPWMDRDKYAARLQQLLQDKPLARKMGDEGHRMVDEQYSFAEYILGLEAMFRKVIDESHLIDSPLQRA